jgi:hypothetical protein
MNARLGVLVRVDDARGVTAGFVHAPPPILPGDVVALAHGPPLRILSVAPAPGLVVVRASPARLAIAAV